MEKTKNKIDQALQIVKEDLKKCYTKDGIIASPVNFSNYWARDSFWASLGMIHGDKKDLAMTKKSLELFAKYQTKSGKIPRKIVSDINILKRIGIKINRSTLFPVYISPISFFYSFDDNLLFVISFCSYFKKTKDVSFLRKNFRSLKKALLFYEKRFLLQGDLLYEFGLGNWMDTVLKRGFILYTNCLWFKALEDFNFLASQLKEKPPISLPSPTSVKKKINEEFWNEELGFFVDALSRRKKQKKFFDTSANLLVILFEITDKEKNEKLFQKIKTLESESNLHPINNPLYPVRKINPLTYLFGIQRYHNGISWSWVEIIHVLALAKTNKKQEAKKQLENISKIIIQNETLHETYTLKGKPFDHLLWKSANPFAWSSGLFLLATKNIQSESS